MYWPEEHLLAMQGDIQRYLILPYYRSNARRQHTLFSLSPSERNGNRQEADGKKKQRTRIPDITKLWQRRKLHTETLSGGKDPRRVFVYLRLTPRQIEISICNLARGSDHPGIPPAADHTTNRDWLVPDLPIRQRVARWFLRWPILLNSNLSALFFGPRRYACYYGKGLPWLTLE